MIAAKDGRPIQPESLDVFFQKGELVPAVVQEKGTGCVLMLAAVVLAQLPDFRKKREAPAPEK